MAFLINCPNCGFRDVQEYRFGGEVQLRPTPEESHDSWTSFLYDRYNKAGNQKEWWYHRLGCRNWFIATRNTNNNEINDVSWPDTDLS